MLQTFAQRHAELPGYQGEEGNTLATYCSLAQRETRPDPWMMERKSSPRLQVLGELVRGWGVQKDQKWLVLWPSSPRPHGDSRAILSLTTRGRQVSLQPGDLTAALKWGLCWRAVSWALCLGAGICKVGVMIAPTPRG